MFFSLTRPDQIHSTPPDAVCTNDFQIAAEAIFSEVIDVKGAYYKCFHLLCTQFSPYISDELNAQVMSEALPFFQKIHYDSVGYHTPPLFFAAAAQFLLEDAEVSSAWRELYRAMQVGYISEIQEQFIVFIELATNTIASKRAPLTECDTTKLSLIQSRGEALLFAAAALEPSRNYSYILKEGTYLVFNSKEESLDSSGSPFYSDADRTYQAAVILFLQDTLLFPNPLTPSSWVDVCLTEYEHLFEYYDKIVQEAASDSAIEEEAFIFSEDLTEGASDLKPLQSESFALALLIRIAEYYHIIPDFPADNAIFTAFVEKRQAAQTFIEHFYFFINVAKESNDYSALSHMADDFLRLAVQFSEYVIKDPQGPLKGNPVNRLARPPSISSTTTSHSRSSFGSPSSFSPRKSLSSSAPSPLFKRSSREELGIEDNSTPRARINPIVETDEEWE